jgi:hypothetical protein
MSAWALAANTSDFSGHDRVALTITRQLRIQAAYALGSTIVLVDPRTREAYYRGLANLMALEHLGGADVLVIAEVDLFPIPVPLEENGFYFERALGRMDNATRAIALNAPLRRLTNAAFRNILLRGDPDIGEVPSGLSEAAMSFELTQPTPESETGRTLAAVLKAYDNRCAFTGRTLELLLTDVQDIPCTMIIPFEDKGRFEPGNVIPAAPGPRAAFRAGKLSIDQDGGFLVALSGIEPQLPMSLNRSHKLAVPNDPTFAPDPGKLHEHRKVSFLKEG